MEQSKSARLFGCVFFKSSIGYGGLALYVENTIIDTNVLPLMMPYIKKSTLAF